VTSLHPLAALSHRNFRLLWLGQGISLAGSMMQNAAVLWHVSLLADDSHRALALGLVGLVKVLPIVAFSLVGGVVADALDRRALMFATQTLMLAFAATLSWLSFRGLEELWPIYLLTALGSAAGSFDGPARMSLLPSLVPRELLAGAISLNTIVFQLAAVLGPSLFAIAIARLGLGWVYALNAVSFLAVIVALVQMRGLPPREATTRSEVSLRAAVEGLRFVFAAPLIRSSMLLDFFATFFSSATALLPLFAQDILRVGPVGFGWLYAAPSTGALLASAAMIRFERNIERRGAVLLAAVAIYGIATFVFGLSTSFFLTLACLAVTGAADTVSMVLRNVIRQLGTPDHLRGRMTSVNMIFFMGGPQLGELEAGLVAQAWGAPFSVVSGGVACLAATAWVAWTTPSLRRYRR
jgi:MFS family permease